MPARGRRWRPSRPHPRRGRPPSRWGDPDALAALLAPAGLDVTDAREDWLELRFPTPAEAVAFPVDTAGHVAAELPRLVAEGRFGALLADLGALVRDRDEGAGGECALRLGYLLARAAPRADRHGAR